MVRQRQRRNRLAREKHERQAARRSVKERRGRVVSIIVFSILGLIGVIAVVLFVAQILDQEEDNKNPSPGDTTVTPLDPEQLPSDTGTTGDTEPSDSAPTNTTPSEAQGN